ncbi:MAG: type IV pilus modification PilV family protein [bacterium]
MKQTTNDKRAQRGYTLLEVLLASFILSMGLLTMAHVQISSMRGNNKSAHYTSATILAENKIEEIKKEIKKGNFSDLAAMIKPDDSPIDSEGVAGRTQSIFTRTCEVENYPTDSPKNLKKITVTVSWPEHDKTHDISFSTVVSDYF